MQSKKQSDPRILHVSARPGEIQDMGRSKQVLNLVWEVKKEIGLGMDYSAGKAKPDVWQEL